MAKFVGAVGYAVSQETGVDVWVPVIEEVQHIGDVLVDLTVNSQTSDKVDDDISIRHKISIMMDPYAEEHWPNMKYIKWMGTKWKITSVEVKYPRLILTIGGVYNYDPSRTI